MLFFFHHGSSLGGSAGLRIPAYHSGAVLLDYVPQVCTLLKNKVSITRLCASSLYTP